MKKFKKAIIATTALFSFLLCSCNKNDTPTPTPDPDPVDPDVPEEEYTDTKIDNFDALNFEHVRYLGRYYKGTMNEKECVLFAFSATGFELVVDIKSETNSITANFYSYMEAGHSNQYIRTFVDGEVSEKIALTRGDVEVKLFENLSVGKHVLKVVKLNEASQTKMGVYSIESENVDFYSRTYKETRKYIEYFGDSITAGYGVLGSVSTAGYNTEDQDITYTYGYGAAEELGVDCSIIAWSGIALTETLAPYEVSFIPKYDTYDGTVKYDLSNDNPAILVINLGSNDNGVYTETTDQEVKDKGIEEVIENYAIIVDSILSHSPNTKVISMYNCAGALAKGLSQAIIEATENINTKYGENTAFTVRCTPEKSGTNSHPGVPGHQAFQKLLVKCIEDNNLL